MKDIEIYEAVLGFFLTLVITLIKNFILDKKNVSEVIFIGAIGWASHFAARKILKTKFKEDNNL
tara:strand:+ start:151 stop:342 length:192 start_codon:yes stop_codon:yes gene_type:complete